MNYGPQHQTYTPRMTKRVAFDFWQIETPAGQPNFAEILRQASQIDQLQARVRELGNRTLRYEILRRESRLYVGDLIKLRMDELPGMASESTPRQDLPLRQDQGITEETAFAFDTQTSALITQKNFFGPSASLLVEYFRVLTNYQGAISCNLLVSEEGFQKLSSMRRIKKMVFKVARPQRGTIARAKNTSVGGALSILDDLSAMNVEMGVSVGRYDSELDKSRVIATVRDLLRLKQNNDEAVEKILVTGKDEEDSRDMFDLLEYRLRSYQDVAVDPAHRTMTASARINGVINAFRQKGDELTAILSPNGN